jgi:hypothetical protein
MSQYLSPVLLIFVEKSISAARYKQPAFAIYSLAYTTV